MEEDIHSLVPESFEDLAISDEVPEEDNNNLENFSTRCRQTSHFFRNEITAYGPHDRIGTERLSFVSNRMSSPLISPPLN
jgi:hypothetical protein